MEAFLDNPLFLSVAFHPRQADRGSSSVKGAVDGTVRTADGVDIGYRFFPLAEPRSDAPLLLYFHGNAEIAADSDYSAGAMRHVGASLLAVDFRGYGWSSGSPLLSTLLRDAEAIVDALPDILRPSGHNVCPVFLFGRSIGSTCAVHLASKYPDAFRGLVLEGALTVITELPMVQQLALMMPNGTQLLASIPDIFQQEAKLRRCVMPVLVLHGEDDEIIPVRQGQALYAASAAPAALKRIRRFPNAGHNNLMERHHEAYLAVLKSFLNDVLGVSDPVLAARVQEHGAQEDISVRDAALRTMKTQADALIHKGEFEEACRKLTELLRLAPDGDSNMHAEACLQRAQCYLARGRRDECVDDCTTVLRLRPEDTIARTLRARCYWRMGLLSLALDDAKVLEQALLQCHGVDPVRARRLIAFSISLPSTSS